MKNALAFAAVLLALGTQPVFATSEMSFGDAAVAEHSGGCRKDSPKGQCCHAGSQPYHCH